MTLEQKSPGRDVAVWPGLFIQLYRERVRRDRDCDAEAEHVVVSASFRDTGQVLPRYGLEIRSSSEAGAACLQTEAKNHAADRAA